MVNLVDTLLKPLKKSFSLKPLNYGKLFYSNSLS
jgi:hypothetical protein